MQIDVNEIIKIMSNRIAQLEIEKAILQAELNSIQHEKIENIK